MNIVSSRARGARRFVAALVLGGTALVATACPPDSGTPGTTTTTTTIDPANNLPPVIGAFAAASPVGSSPLTTAFQWSITDPNGPGGITCSLDLDGNSSFEVTVPGCTSSSVRSASYTAVGGTTATLRVSDGLNEVTATTTVTVTVPSADTFGITVRLNGTMTPSQQAAFTAAAARWAQVIRTGLSDVNLTIPADDCGTGAPAFSGTIDDVVIDATIAPIDGVGSILGQAGPCYTRVSNGLPLYGVMLFDSADVANLQTAGDFDAVILHEMGHVLGIGTVWGSNLSGAGSADPRFTGITTIGAWQALGGVGSVPVENSGGSGTADSHWRESVFNGELMTGYIDHNNNPMSRVTVASLTDIGYGVDLGATDPYGLPGLRAGDGDEGPGRHLDVRLVTPKGSV